MKIFDTLDMTSPGVKCGNHGIWLAKEQIKVPFQWGGKITKFSRPGEAFGSRETIVDEYLILKALAKEGFAPPIGDFVFFKNVISRYPGAYHIDPCGAFGYEIGDANRQAKPGRFYRDELEKLPVEGSSAAWGDVVKRDNVVNGYLIDVRRSCHDLLKWKGPRTMLPSTGETADLLKARVHRECQFPPGERSLAYQDFWVYGQLERGQRRVVERATALGFMPKVGESVLDIGCQSGSFLQYAWISAQGQPSQIAGVEYNASYVDCARALARSCEQNICIRQMDVVKEVRQLLAWVKEYYPKGVDHLLLLSMEKHLGEGFVFTLIDTIKPKHAYIETNAVAEDSGKGPEPAGTMKMLEGVKQRRGIYVGPSRDRNLRRLYRISK